MDEESRPETSIGKGEVETDKAEGNIREVDKNESSIDEKGGETKSSTTGEGGTETVREKQVDEDVTKHADLMPLDRKMSDWQYDKPGTGGAGTSSTMGEFSAVSLCEQLTKPAQAPG